MSQGSTALKHWTVSLQLVSKLEVQDEKYKKAHITKSQGVQIRRRRNSFRTCRPQTTTREVLNNEDQICRSVSLASGDVLLVVEEEGQKAKCCCCSFVKVKQEFFVGFFWGGYTRDSRLSAVLAVPTTMVPLLSEDWRVFLSSCVPMRLSMALYRNWYCSWKTTGKQLLKRPAMSECSSSFLQSAVFIHTVFFWLGLKTYTEKLVCY